MEKLNSRICSVCGKEYQLTEKQKKEIMAEAKNKTENFILTCPLCHSLDFVNPLEMLGLSTKRKSEIVDNRLFCCPIEGCIGFVEEDEDIKGLYGCSECGTEWKSMDAIFKDIERIIKKYPYRKDVYIKEGNAFKSISFSNIPKGYYKKVQNE